MTAYQLREALAATGTGQAKLAIIDRLMALPDAGPDAPAEKALEALAAGGAPEGTMAKARALLDGAPVEAFIGAGPTTAMDASEDRLIRVFKNVFRPEEAAEERAKADAVRQERARLNALADRSNWVAFQDGDAKGWRNTVTGDVALTKAPPTYVARADEKAAEEKNEKKAPEKAPSVADAKEAAKTGK